MSEPTPIALNGNGAAHRLFVQPWHTLLHVLRDEIGLTGAKRGCNQGVCGACSVLIDGEVARGCLSLAINCTGREITTIEGLAPAGELSPVQQAFMDTGAVQCGFCTPGMIMAAEGLLRDNPNPTVDDIRAGMAANICRCTGYVKIIEAVQAAAEEIAA